MTRQIIECARCIPNSLFEAVANLDAGPIHLQSAINLNGTELVEEWRELQAEATINLFLQWLDRYLEPPVIAAVDRLIPASIQIAPWPSSLNCCGWLITIATQPSLNGVGGAMK